jgi:hypothetical protein
MIFPKGNTLNVLRRLISHEDDEEQKQIGIYSASKLKHRENGFAIR